MADYTFGANILENLTTGMYQDSKVIYREYIQNACDQIDKAEKLGILPPREKGTPYPDLGKGEINIWLDSEKRNISIEDNATGIQASEFQRILGGIADSDKVMGEDKGFRGIGRLCGLAYCKELIFTSRWKDENIVSIMRCDAQKMREMINDANTKKQKHSAVDVLNSIVEFTTRPATKEDLDHFFRVDLMGINEENNELFGEKNARGFEELTNYLSFVAPVPYSADFYYRTEIYKFCSEQKINLDEYTIKIDGEQIFKKYKTHLKTGKGEDYVFGIEFKKFLANDETLLAWMWFGKTTFKASIKIEEMSRCIRLRKENIQIGDETTLRDFFSSEQTRRGNSYFIGELFALSRDLVPNSQRSYFNENKARIKLENVVTNYFSSNLTRIFNEGSVVNSSIRDINSYTENEEIFNNKLTTGSFLTKEEQVQEKKKLEEEKEKALKAKNKLKKMLSNPKTELSKHIVERRLDDIQDKNFLNNEATLQTSQPIRKKSIEDTPATPSKNADKFLVDSLFPRRNNAERKLLSNVLDKIFKIIQSSADKKTSEHIIKEIKENLK